MFYMLLGKDRHIGCLGKGLIIIGGSNVLKISQINYVMIVICHLNYLSILIVIGPPVPYILDFPEARARRLASNIIELFRLINYSTGFEVFCFMFALELIKRKISQHLQ